MTITTTVDFVEAAGHLAENIGDSLPASIETTSDAEETLRVFAEHYRSLREARDGKATVEVEIPYEETALEVELTPDGSYRRDLLWLHNNMSEEEAPRIFTSATVLFHAGAGSFAECLHTAIVWERG